MQMREERVWRVMLLQTEPLKTVVVNARVHDARVGGKVCIGGGWRDEKMTTRTVWSEMSASPGSDIQRRSSRILTATTGMKVCRSVIHLDTQSNHV